MRQIAALFILMFLKLAMANTAEGAVGFIKLGPTGLGNGGPNPLGIPPNATDIEVGFATDSGFETTIGLPGLLFGYRGFSKWGGYVSSGGGIVIDANGAGPGAYSAFGVETGKSVKFYSEYKQTIGITQVGLISPFAVRIGFGLEF